MSMELRFGINLLQNLPYAELAKRWQQVEALGYDSLWLADHYYMRFSPDGICSMDGRCWRQWPK